MQVFLIFLFVVAIELAGLGASIYGNIQGYYKLDCVETICTVRHISDHGDNYCFITFDVKEDKTDWCKCQADYSRTVGDHPVKCFKEADSTDKCPLAEKCHSETIKTTSLVGIFVWGLLLFFTHFFAYPVFTEGENSSPKILVYVWFVFLAVLTGLGLSIYAHYAAENVCSEAECIIKQERDRCLIKFQDPLDGENEWCHCQQDGLLYGEAPATCMRNKEVVDYCPVQVDCYNDQLRTFSWIGIIAFAILTVVVFLANIAVCVNYYD